MQELWKDIIGYEELYQVNNCGLVKSLPKNCGWRPSKEKILKEKTTKFGYKSVGLCKKNKIKWFMVHRLVAIAFIPNNLKKPQVNHKNGDKSNNSVENLEWVTCSENHKHMYRTGLRSMAGENHNNRKLNENDVSYIRENVKMNWNRRKTNYIELAKKFNVCRGTISQIVNGKSWMCAK